LSRGAGGVPGRAVAAAQTLACAVAFTLALVAAAPARAAEGFSAALAQKLQTERPAAIDLGTVAPFNWDELFIFAPGTPREANCKAIQGTWLECRTTLPDPVPADRFLLVFRAKGRIVRAEPHLRANGEFVTASLPQPVRRATARFKAIPGDGSGFKLEWTSPN
jgi:hypothetical protein